MKIFTTIVLTILVFNMGFSQFPGEKSKDDFKAIDNFTYKIGSQIEISNPTKGSEYNSILIYKSKNFIEQADEVLNGTINPNDKLKIATKDIRGFKGKIIYFKEFKSKEDKIIHVAILPYKNGMNLGVILNSAIPIGEIISNNPDYYNEIELSQDNKENNGTYIKSFSPNFEVKLLSAKGHKETQTIEFEILIKHKLVHQEICFKIGKNDAKMYDFEGNEYLAKSAFIGALNGTLYSVCNKIPTNIPVKTGIVFRQVLSDKVKVSFVTIKVGFKATDGGKYEFGTIEMGNIDIKWE